MRLHRQAAQVLQEIYGSHEEPHLAELAHHFFEAAPLGDTAIAVDYARRAGEQAAQSLAYEEAARLYRMAVGALELCEHQDEELQGQLLLALGDASARAGDLLAAREAFFRVATIARRTGAASQLAQASLGYGGRFVWARAGDDPHLVAMLQDALVLLGGGDDRLRVRLLARLACALRSSPDRERSDTLSRQALETARGLSIVVADGTLSVADLGNAGRPYRRHQPAQTDLHAQGSRSRAKKGLDNRAYIGNARTTTRTRPEAE
jgi:hypothetical protein